MPPTSERIKTAIQDGAESFLPEGLITSGIPAKTMNYTNN